MAVRPGKRGSSWFWKAALFLVLLMVPLGIGVLGMLWDFLEEYQESLPENAAQQGLMLFENQQLEALAPYFSYTPHPLEAEGNFAQAVEQYFAPKEGGKGEYSLIPKVGTGSEKRFVVALDGVQIAELVLTPSGKTQRYQLDTWQISDIEVSPISGKYGVEILAPAGIQLTINANDLSQDYMVDNAVAMDVSGYRELPEGYGQPTYIRYRVEGLLQMPQVEAQAVDGGSCALNLTEEKDGIAYYEVIHYASEEFASASGVKAENVAKLYAEFITKDASFGELLPYLLENGSLYNHLYGFSNAWYITHDANAFENLEMDNFILYDASHYSCNIQFDYYIYMGSKSYQYPTAYTLYFVREGEQWKLASLEVR